MQWLLAYGKQLSHRYLSMPVADASRDVEYSTRHVKFQPGSAPPAFSDFLTPFLSSVFIPFHPPELLPHVEPGRLSKGKPWFLEGVRASKLLRSILRPPLQQVHFGKASTCPLGLK